MLRPENGLFPATSAAGVPLRHQGLGTPAEETKHTRSVRYQLMRPGRPRPQACRSGSSGPAQLQEGGAQNRHAYLCQTSHWHLPDTGGIKVLAWPTRTSRSLMGFSTAQSAHKTYFYGSPRVELCDPPSVAPYIAGGGAGETESVDAQSPRQSQVHQARRRGSGSGGAVGWNGCHGSLERPSCIRQWRILMR